MTKNVARRAYSAEQLLALRHSASDEPAIQIEANAENGAIKDHVVRNARSFAARSSRSLATSESMRPPSTDHRQSSAPVLGEIDPNNQTLRPGLNLNLNLDLNRHRPSPSPSLKKRKAEQILKDHGSPPGLRVTAGGRIVPSDQSPLCSPRYGYSAIKKNGMLVKFGPNYPPPLSAIALQKIQGLPNGFVAQDPNGRLCQMVNGQFLQVGDINGIPQLYIAAPNLNGFPLGNIEDPAGSTPFDNAIPKQASQGREGSSTGPPIKQTAMKQPTISVTMQIQALEKQYTKLEQESRDLDKVEVLQRSSMGAKAYNQLIQKRRELVGRLNEIRISLKALRDAKPSTKSSPAQGEQHPMQPQFGMPPFPGHPMMAAGLPLPDWSFDGISPEAHGGPPFPTAPPHPELGFFGPPGGFPGPVPPYPGMFGPMPPMYNIMGMPPIDATFNGYLPNIANGNPQAFSNGSPPAPRTEPMPEGDASSRRNANDAGSNEKDSPRRPHALEIKNPGSKSAALNPMSPSYQPAPNNAKTSTPAPKAAQAYAGSPSPALAEAVRAHNAWVSDSANASNSAGSRRGIQYESSASSYATADFFPNNPRDHSMRKDVYPISEKRSMDRVRFKEERPAANHQPVTPEKELHNPDWTPAIPDTTFDSAIMPPIEQQAVVALSGTSKNKADPISNRSEINVSPKSRRPDYLMNFTSVSDVTTMTSGVSVPPTGQTKKVQQIVPSESSAHGFDHEAVAYMEGFEAGEARMPIGPDKTGLWLDGYCAGLMKSNQPSNASSSSKKQRVDTHAHQGDSQAVQNDQPSKRLVPAIDIKPGSMDNLKEAVFSAQNENAILTPEPNTSSAGGVPTPMELGGWAKTHDTVSSTVPDAILAQMRNGKAAFPERTSSMVQRQLSGPGSNVATEQGRAPPATCSKARQVVMEPEQSQGGQDRRTTSSQSQPGGNSPSSYFQRAYPGHRVLSSQLEWKSGSSIAQVAGLATGYFAQYDGTRHDTGTLGDKRPLTQVSGNAGMTTQDAQIKAMPEKHVGSSPCTQARFTEASMATDEQTGSSPSSPGKKSPAKVKFAQIAGKAGIKVRSDNKEENEGEAMSPNEKRRWRDVWRKRFTEGREGDYEHGGRH